MITIVGLGNPGVKYKKTRHNVGFMATDHLAQMYDVLFNMEKKFKAMSARLPFATLLKPETYMNNSGESVRAFLAYYKQIPKKYGVLKQKDVDFSDKLVVIHDDLDIELGEYKVSMDSRSGGHKGVESIILHLKTKKFKRIRIGIKPFDNKIEIKNYVLEKFSPNELSKINVIIKKVIKNELDFINILNS